MTLALAAMLGLGLGIVTGMPLGVINVAIVDTSTDTVVTGISTLMGPARLAIIVCPTSRKVGGVMAAMDRLRLNHVPQNTPATSMNRLIVTS